MKLTIKTIKLQEMLSKSVKCAGNNKLVPISSLLGIKQKDNQLELTTTNVKDYLYVREENECDGEFSVTVYVDTFSKLISKLTCEYVSLELKDSCLEVTGNGTYKINLPLDENGDVIKYPNPVKTYTENAEFSETGEIELFNIKTISNSIKPALAVTPEVPCYMAYYMGDKVIATDTYKIAGLMEKVFDKPKLLSANTIELLTLIEEPKVKFTAFANGTLLFETPKITVFSSVVEGLEDYAVDAITNLLNLTTDSYCEIVKDSLLQLLDRLALFVSPYDKNAVNLTFTNDGIVVTSKSSSGEELIPYATIHDFKEFTCAADIQMLQTQIKAIPTNLVTLYFGSQQALKLKTNNLIQIIGLLSD